MYTDFVSANIKFNKNCQFSLTKKISSGVKKKDFHILNITSVFSKSCIGMFWGLFYKKDQVRAD